MLDIEFWKFFAGLGFFLYGMSQLEKMLKNASGRSFKLFLKRNTESLFKSILGGAIITGIVQSSSVISLVVLAFVESGMITFRNALGVILGANLGTTLDSWIVASLGFKLNILNYSLPIIAISSIGIFFFERRRRVYNILFTLFALGILFLGLGLMKEGALAMVKNFDLKFFAQYSLFVFVVVGFVLTSIIQSSSATMAITLTALYTNALSFPAAAAIVLGSELGTTIKILLWSFKGSADKKRVGLGNFIYNLFSVSLGYIFLHWIIYFIEMVVVIKDPLIGLVFFQSMINLTSILLFLPFLSMFSRWLEQKFKNEFIPHHSYISPKLPIDEFLVANAIRKESLNLFNKTIIFNESILEFELTDENDLLSPAVSNPIPSEDIEEEYRRLKQTEGDIIEYYNGFNEVDLSADDKTIIGNYFNAIRQTIYAAKAIKDIAHNLREFNASAKDIKYQQCNLISVEWQDFDKLLNQLMEVSTTQILNDEIEKAQDKAIAHEELMKLEVMAHLKADALNEVEASTIMNVHRELLSCKKSLLMALKKLKSE